MKLADYSAAMARYSTLNATHLKMMADSCRVQAEMAAVYPDNTPEDRQRNEADYLNLAFDYDAMARNASHHAADWAKDAAEAQERAA